MLAVPAGEQGTVSLTNPSRAVKCGQSLLCLAMAGGGWAETGGLSCPCAPSLSPLRPILSVLFGASPCSGVACPLEVTQGCEE